MIFFKVLESTLFWWVFLFSYQRSHIIRTIAVPSESLLNELRIVEVSHLDKATLAMGYTCRLCYWLTMYYSSYASICIFLELQCSLRKGKSLWCFVSSLPHLPLSWYFCLSDFGYLFYGNFILLDENKMQNSCYLYRLLLWIHAFCNMKTRESDDYQNSQG